MLGSFPLYAKVTVVIVVFARLKALSILITQDFRIVNKKYIAGFK